MAAAFWRDNYDEQLWDVNQLLQSLHCDVRASWSEVARARIKVAGEPGARSPEPGVRSPESGARSPEPGARSPEPGARSPESGARSPEPGPLRCGPASRTTDPHELNNGFLTVQQRVKRRCRSSVVWTRSRGIKALASSRLHFVLHRVLTMRSGRTSLFLLLLAAQAVYTHYARCDCNGRSPYCLRDASGLRCVDCQGNTAGRRCERCKDGFHLTGAPPSCTPCRCNLTGAVAASCDSRGRCSCKERVTGDKCDRCPDGPIGPNGCSLSRRPREDSGSRMCFCYGHSSKCSAQSGYSVHSIASTFTDGPDGWKAATAEGVTPGNVHFRWSPKHHDLEVISKNSLPVYLFAPAPYLGNQLLSFGQNLSFSLRLDRGVRHPSTSDVVLEGAGLRAAASLGDLRSIVPCGQKINYSFRLDEQPGSRWRPQLSASQFQTLLQNLTAIKIRATFGENGRGYLANVRLVTARRGDGAPASWVQTCSCPPGYEGEFCDRCSAGFRRGNPADGAFGSCEPCSCRGGSCDPQTGDCYSADETPGELSCSEGFYRDAWPPRACVRCPCPDGVTCQLAAGALAPRCDRCPTGTTGPRCNVCQEGFYGEPPRGDVAQQTCRPCRCNGHIDVRVEGSCDRSSGECLKCLNNTTGPSCEACVPGFYRATAAAACKPCDCDLLGSESRRCDDAGRCRCRPGREGLRCQRSDCPACFSPIKTKMEAYASKLKELETRFSGPDGGLKPAGRDQIEASLRATEELVDDLQYDAELLAGLEKNLQSRLASISRSQLAEGRVLQDVGDAADDVKREQRTYKTKVEEVQRLVDEMKRKLDEAKADLRSAEIPLGDAPLGANLLSSLEQTARSLADEHQTKADAVQQSAKEALSDSEKSLALVRTLMGKENKVKELIGDLKTTYEKASAQVKGLEDQATRLGGEARGESSMADGMLKDIAALERNVPSSLKGQVDAMVSRLDDVKQAVDGDISDLEALQDGVQRDKTATGDLLDMGKVAQQDFNKLLDRVNVAKADTEGALQRISSNTKELDDALDTLRGFDQQIDGGKALAGAAIKRLPGIEAAVKQAVGNNAKTASALGDVSQDYEEALGSIDALQDLVSSLEGSLSSWPSHAGLLDEATALNRDAQDLKTRAGNAAADLQLELDAGRTLQDAAGEAVDGAAAALDNARRTGDAVGQTLRDVSRLLANMNQSVPVDETQLKKMEASVADAHRQVEDFLRPRLREAELLEADQRRRLTGVQRDVDSILRDIANLEEILEAVPKGCYNSPPIEVP
ncbi:laminin subunit gamma-2 [Clinocottus analis]|uniref:laminin subunit gamma-2 n=1 Tax=Clinocottus analis TaxID=304258 RepID=UPI0035C138EA